MKKFLIICLLLCTLPLFAQQTEIKYLSGEHTDDNVEWNFHCSAGRNSGEWTKIRVPSCWELEGFGGYNYGHDANKNAEVGTYRTAFTLPDSWKNKRIFIVFEGSMTDTKVVVNGRQAGDIHQGAFYRFKREITSLVSYGKNNVLEVEVSKMSSNKSINAAERSADFWVFGGIYRPVYLEAVPDNFIEYTSFDARQDGTVNLEVNLDKPLKNADITVKFMRLDNGRLMGECSQKFKESARRFLLSGKIDGVEPWSAENPRLYKAVVEVCRKGKKIHSLTEKIGFRTLEVKARDGVYINGEKIRFKGINRHCFWPTTGRTVSKAQNLLDAQLIKEMNMNAVRMSHYPPDKHFLEVCDSIGLYVIDELCAWQYPPYETAVGTILVKEMLKRDLNHASVVFWANGNEGGFNFDLDPLFGNLDLQKRAVLHPWGISGNINTAHYINYNSGIKNMFNGRDIFMPTELIHGLYDGGHGAGLDDYWNLMLQNPLSAGMFLWDFSDQAVVRTDQGGILDTDRDHGADGIVGPYREKEGSFYTVKEIWSPIQVEKRFLTQDWNGEFTIENRYDFTNAKECSYSYTLTRYNGLTGIEREQTYRIESPDIAPWCKGKLSLDLPEGWQDNDFLYLTINDKYGKELFTWSFEIDTPKRFARRVLGNPSFAGLKKIQNDGKSFILEANGVKALIDTETGLLSRVAVDGREIPLTNGPVFVNDRQLECKSVSLFEKEEAAGIEVVYRYVKGREAYRFCWCMSDEGVLRLEYRYRPGDNLNMTGITFSFPETGVKGAKLLANGPYRVYNNRMKGGTVRLWSKEYNDAITGEVWQYPEFKGYYSLFYGMKLDCPTPFEVYTANEDVILHLFTPRAQKLYDLSRNYTLPDYPTGDISFMDAIPAVGTKFGKAENYGPQSQLHRFKYYSGVRDMENSLYFKFK